MAKKKSAMNPELVPSIMVPHSAFADGEKRLRRAYEGAKRGTISPDCFAIVGEWGVGKSRLQQRMVQLHPPIRTSEGLNLDVICVKIPAEPRLKALVEFILKALGDPQWHAKESENIKTERIKHFAKRVGLKILFLDEFQHFLDKGKPQLVKIMLDWLKVLIDENNFCVVIAGLDESLGILRQNPQLKDRFQRSIRLPRFDWRIENDREEWLGILDAFYEKISEQHDIVELHAGDFAFRLYIACAGSIRRLRNTLHNAVEAAALENRREISVNDIAEGYRVAVDDDMMIEGRGVFDMSFTPSQPSLLVAQALAAARLRDGFEAPPTKRRGRPRNDVADTFSTRK